MTSARAGFRASNLWKMTIISLRRFAGLLYALCFRAGIIVRVLLSARSHASQNVYARTIPLDEVFVEKRIRRKKKKTKKNTIPAHNGRFVRNDRTRTPYNTHTTNTLCMYNIIRTNTHWKTRMLSDCGRDRQPPSPSPSPLQLRPLKSLTLPTAQPRRAHFGKRPCRWRPTRYTDTNATGAHWKSSKKFSKKKRNKNSFRRLGSNFPARDGVTPLPKYHAFT